MKVAFATLGCKVNHYETEAMRGLFLAAGWTDAPFSEQADVYIVNSCTVTNTGDAKTRQLLSRAHAAHPEALIVAAGCYAQIAPDALLALPGVSLVVGTTERKEIVHRVEAALAARNAGGAPKAFVADLREERNFEALSALRDSRTRATLKIEDGCRNYCSYCAIPFARGPVRSRPLEDVKRELKALAAEGYLEVVLTGIHLASYGKDLTGVKLADAMEAACNAGIPRVRLGSLEPRLVTPDFARFAAGLPALCRQFHLSLQSGSDTVLSRMNRHYTAAEYRQSVQLLREEMPDCAVTTDVIAGFPGETEAEHRESLAFVEEIGFARTHVFPYSRRPGTRAAEMPGQIPKALRESRAAEMTRLAKGLEAAFIESQLGLVHEVLVEKDGVGYTGNYIRARTDAPDGTLCRVRLVGTENGMAVGERIKD